MHDPVATLTAAFALYGAAGLVSLVVLLWRDRDEILRPASPDDPYLALPRHQRAGRPAMSAPAIFLLCAAAFSAFVGFMADGKREYRCEIGLREAGL